MPRKKQPCIVKGVRYESECAAARALGVQPYRVRSRFRSSNFPEYVSKYHKKRKCTRNTSPSPCVIKGIEYASISEAARQLGKITSTIFIRLGSFQYPDYICAGIPKRQPKYTYTVKGKKYATLQEIADVEGVSMECIRLKMNDPKQSEYQRFSRLDEQA